MSPSASRAALCRAVLCFSRAFLGVVLIFLRFEA